jgi:hypothetical protein
MVTRRVEIDNREVRIFEDDEEILFVEVNAATAKFFGQNVMNGDFGLLPRGLRWMSVDRHTLAIQIPAGIVKTALAFPGKFTTLPMPFQLLLVSFSNDYTAVERLQYGWSPTPIQSLGAELVPFPLMATLDIPSVVPTTLQPRGSMSVGKFLTAFPSHLYAQLYRLWTATIPHVGAPLLEQVRLPETYDLPEEGEHRQADFVQWWSEQTLEQVAEWTWTEGRAVPLKNVLGAIDAPPVYDNSFDFFVQLVTMSGGKARPKKVATEAELAQVIRVVASDASNTLTNAATTSVGGGWFSPGPVGADVDIAAETAWADEILNDPV